MEYGPHFSDAHRVVLERMRQLLGDAVVVEMLTRAGNPDAQVAMVEAFANLGTQDQGENPVAQLAESNARLAEQVHRHTEVVCDEMHRQSNVMQEEMHRQSNVMQEEMHRQSNVMQENFAAMHQHSQTRRGPKAVMLAVPRYEGKDSENLLRWLLEVSIAANAQLIDNEQMKIAFAMSHMGGRAREWVYTQMMMNPQCFPTWDIFVNKVRGVFMPPNWTSAI